MDITTYSPANANNLTEEQLLAMRDLTDSDIDELAQAYPNQATGNAYLMFYLTGEPEDKQRYPLGTWATLNSLRKLGRKDVLPFSFRKGAQVPMQLGIVAKKDLGKTRVIDLSKDEAIEGLKAADEIVTAPVVGLNENTNAPAVVIAGKTDLVLAYEAAEEELAQAKTDQAHHMTIKSLEKKVEAAKADAGLA